MWCSLGKLRTLVFSDSHFCNSPGFSLAAITPVQKHYSLFFNKHIITEPLPPSLIGSALTSSTSHLELPGIGSAGQARSFQQLLTETSPVAALVPKCGHKNPIQCGIKCRTVHTLWSALIFKSLCYIIVPIWVPQILIDGIKAQNFTLGILLKSWYLHSCKSGFLLMVRAFLSVRH